MIEKCKVEGESVVRGCMGGWMGVDRVDGSVDWWDARVGVDVGLRRHSSFSSRLSQPSQITESLKTLAQT